MAPIASAVNRFAFVVAMLLPTLLWVSSEVAAADDPTPASLGIGGGPSFTQNSVIRVGQGQSIPPVLYLMVQNTGSGAAEVVFESSSPPGIKTIVASEEQKFTLAPTEVRRVSFGLEVSPGQPVGMYSVQVQAKQTNVPQRPGKTVVAPGLVGDFNAQVVGESADVVVSARSKNDGSAVVGDIEIEYIPERGAPFLVAAAKPASDLPARLAAGRYRATVTIAGLNSKSKQFELKKDDDKTVVIELEALKFTRVVATPRPSLDGIVDADLAVNVANELRELPGPITFRALVTRDGTQIDEVEMQVQPSLPTGQTTIHRSYIPAGGWTTGEYRFSFEVVAPTFTITSEEVPSISLGGLKWWVVAAAIAVGLAVVGWLLIRRGRRRGR